MGQKKQRTNINLPERSFKRIETLKEMTDASSTTEVVKAALHLYETVALQIAGGAEISLRKPDGTSTRLELMIDLPRAAAADGAGPGPA
ncbi:hypothetical protein AB9K35_04300 [Leisingera sp. XS_AS12]|uniref:hypothetical protein n=1 Tax=Leisingera sp. XS_AS12 TaxID=3241294 RepID=UPI003511854D